MKKNLYRSFAPTEMNDLEFENILGAPLLSAGRANGELAREQARFITDTFFTFNDGTLKPIMVKMLVQRSFLSGDDGLPSSMERYEATIEIPLMTLVPISSLAVTEVDISFAMDVRSHREIKTTEDDTKSSSGAEERKSRVRLFGKLKGNSKRNTKSENASKSSESKSLSSSLHVSVHAEKIPLPPGLTGMISMFSKSFYPSLPEKKGSTE